MRSRLPIFLLFFCLMESMTPVNAQPSTRTTCAIVRHAKLVLTPSKTGPFWGGNGGHEVQKSARHSVLLIRVYEDPGTGPDSQTFTKLSIEFADSRISSSVLPKAAIERSYFVQGFVGEVHKKRFFVADSMPVRFHLTKKGGTTLIGAESIVQSRSAYDGSARLIQFSAACTPEYKLVDQLSPWEGRYGTEWSSFAPSN